MPTDHPKVLRAVESDFPENGHELIGQLIKAAAANNAPRELRRLIASLVPEYVGQVETGEFALPVVGAAASAARERGAGAAALDLSLAHAGRLRWRGRPCHVSCSTDRPRGGPTTTICTTDRRLRRPGRTTRAGRCRVVPRFMSI